MRNKKYYPFERNNYFYGKLLTVRDFLDEQRYMNDKRRLHNYLTVGAGIVCGLSVIELNEKTISVEPGLALDYLGREIVVAEPVTKKLNVIDGFEELKNENDVYLCIEYNEEEEESVHSIMADQAQGSTNNGFNRIKEGFHIFLTDAYVDEKRLTPRFFMEQKQVIYDLNGLKITQIVPRFAKGNQKIGIRLVIEKINLPRMIELNFKYSLVHLANEEGKKELIVYYKDDEIVSYKSTTLSFNVYADDVEQAEGLIHFSHSSASILIENVYFNPEISISSKIEISDLDVNKRIIKKQFERHFDDVATMGAENPIYLARLRLIKQGDEFSIDSFEYLPFQQILLSNSILAMLLENNIQMKQTELKVDSVLSQEQRTNETSNNQPYEAYACGIETIEVDMRSKNKAYFSEEIAHGLGKGDVMLTTALENAAENTIFDSSKNIFGDASVFLSSPYEPSMASVTTAVLSYMDRGTFRIGIKFKDDCNLSEIRMKWWALKLKSQIDTSAAEINNVSVHIEPNTVTIEPREKFKFEAIVIGTDSKDCRFHVSEENGGKIDMNGVYDAPSVEGVYEIVAESVKYPSKRAFAFVVVKEK